MVNGQLGTMLQYIRQLVGPGGAGDQTDGQLLEQFVDKQDGTAFDALVRRHAPLVWGVCRRVLRDEHAAEDVFQATFLVLVRQASGLDRRGSLGNWLYTVAYRLALKSRAKAYHRRIKEQEAGAVEPSNGTVDEADADTCELRSVLDAELSQLPAKYREPLVLCYLQGKSNEEAARELGYPSGSMSRHLTRGKELLRDRLAHRGVALASAALVPAIAESVSAAVSPHLLESTIRAAMSLGAGQVGAFSAEVVALADGFLPAKSWLMAKLVLASVLVVGVVTSGAFAYRAWNAAPDQPRIELGAVVNPSETAALALADDVQRHIEQWEPTRDERRMDLIGWASDLRHARRLAFEHDRPIFLYVHDEGMAIGRCDGGPAHMRTSGLSNLLAIDLLNRHFVPVYINTREYRPTGAAPADEKAEYQRILREIHRAKLTSGTQLAVVLSPDGQPVETMAGCTAAVSSNLIQLLAEQACLQQPAEGATLVQPMSQSRPPHADAESLVLHLTSRYLRREKGQLVPFPAPLGNDKGGTWRDCPAENWIVLNCDATTRLLPSVTVHPGDTWLLDHEIADHLLKHFYPQTEENDLAKNRLDRASLRATLVHTDGKIARARIEGELRMKHRFTGAHEDDRFVDAVIVGYLDYEPGRKRIRLLQLYTPQATYGADPFGVVVRSLP